MENLTVFKRKSYDSAFEIKSRGVITLSNYTPPKFNAENVLNLTITFNPRKFPKHRTIWDGPKAVFEILFSLRQYFKEGYLVEEYHKNGAKHLHGQVILNECETLYAFNSNQVEIYDLLDRKLRSVCGPMCVVSYNTIEKPEVSKWDTYYEYSHKEGKVEYYFED